MTAPVPKSCPRQSERPAADGKFSHTLAAIDHIEASDNRLRRLRPQVVDELAESISRCGLLHPIVVSRSSAGVLNLVAGLHRLEAAKKLGHHNIRVVILDQLDADEAQLTEIDENLVRADLSPAERAIHLAERKRLYEKAHPETVSVRVRGGPGRGKQNESRNAIGFAPAFIDDTAKKLRKHRATVAREVARATKISALADVPGTALDKADELDALAKLPAPVQRDLISRAKSGEKVTARHVAKKLQRDARERDLASATQAASQALGEKRYGVLYADPPWKFEVYKADTGLDHAADAHYPTMPTDQIEALPVPAADDAVLFLWSTPPMQPHALSVMQAWGFTYKSLIIWDKGVDGTGYWVRGRVEILLIGTRGNVPAPLPGEQPPQLIPAQRGRHSEKPAIFAEIIEKLYPNTPKLEMFARTARPFWDAWGNEAPMSEAAS
jgi:N6-adenosine-specific RNA methylase IME4/ParB-like chromosome segregation protein Spo0J